MPLFKHTNRQERSVHLLGHTNEATDTHAASQRSQFLLRWLWKSQTKEAHPHFAKKKTQSRFKLSGQYQALENTELRGRTRNILLWARRVTTAPSWARDSSVNSWYLHLLAVLCFGTKRFHKAAVLVRYLEVKFPFQTRIQFLKEMLCFSIFLITLHVFFPLFSSPQNIPCKRDGLTVFSL